MANSKLKELLKDQVATISEDIQKKIDYLKNGKMFSYSYYKIDVYRQKLSFGGNDALLNAFIGGSGVGESINKDDFANAFMGTNSQNNNVSQSSQSTSEMTAKERVNRLNAKLAALRGVSMPGDYLYKK